MGTIVQMIAATTGGTESALVNIDVPKDGNIVGIEWAVRALYDTTSDQLDFQLSFGTVHNGSNDSRQVISAGTVGGLTFTAGGSVIAQSHTYTQLPDIPVMGGERLYLHSAASAGVVGVIRALVHFDFDLDKVSVRRR